MKNLLKIGIVIILSFISIYLLMGRVQESFENRKKRLQDLEEVLYNTPISQSRNIDQLEDEINDLKNELSGVAFEPTFIEYDPVDIIDPLGKLE